LSGDVEIVRAGAERIADLEPLWASLNEHHVAIAPEFGSLGPNRTREDSWRVRSGLYAEWLQEPDAFALIALDAGRPVGYALVVFRAGEEAWVTGERIAVMETLAVLPSHRDRGLGTRLVEAVFARLRELGVTEWEVSTMWGNREAQRFYERFALRRFVVTYLGRVPEPR
jgi:ribosomal protein S18 acetylase RimI-like enzyme